MKRQRRLMELSIYSLNDQDDPIPPKPWATIAWSVAILLFISIISGSYFGEQALDAGIKKHLGRAMTHIAKLPYVDGSNLKMRSKKNLLSRIYRLELILHDNSVAHIYVRTLHIPSYHSDHGLTYATISGQLRLSHPHTSHIPGLLHQSSFTGHLDWQGQLKIQLTPAQHSQQSHQSQMELSDRTSTDISIRADSMRIIVKSPEVRITPRIYSHSQPRMDFKELYANIFLRQSTNGRWQLQSTVAFESARLFGGSIGYRGLDFNKGVVSMRSPPNKLVDLAPPIAIKLGESFDLGFNFHSPMGRMIGYGPLALAPHHVEGNVRLTIAQNLAKALFPKYRSRFKRWNRQGKIEKLGYDYRTVINLKRNTVSLNQRYLRQAMLRELFP